MGEKITVLSKGKLSGSVFEIELNHPFSKKGHQQVHIQSDKVRIEMDKCDYIKYALSVLAAEEKFKIIKDLQ